MNRVLGQPGLLRPAASLPSLVARPLLLANLAGLFLGLDTASGAPLADSPEAAAKVVSPGRSDAGLVLDAWLSWSEVRAKGLGRLGDATLRLRLSSEAETVRVLHDDAARGWSSLQETFSFELTRDDGRPVSLPRFRLGDGFEPTPEPGTHLDDLAIVELDPGRSVTWSLELRELGGFGGYALDPGVYRLRVHALGLPPDLTEDRCAAYEKLGLGSRDTVSPELEFEIVAPEEPLHWSEPEKGLRVAALWTPFGTRWFLDEEVRAYFLVENVSEETRVIVRDVGEHDGDVVHLRREGAEVPAGHLGKMSAGRTVAWTLEPGQRVWVRSRPLRPWSQFPGRLGAGTYEIQIDVEIRDHRNWPFVVLHTSAVTRGLLWR